MFTLDIMSELENKSLEKSYSNIIENNHSFNEDFSLLNDSFLFSFPSNELNSKVDNSCSLSKTETEKKKLTSGRKRKRKHQLIEGVKIHHKNAPDNILRKIQVHYITFIIDTVNELLNKLEYTEKFIDIDYNEKKKYN